MNANEEACLKWFNVHLAIDTESISGTFFLLNQTSGKPAVQWIADTASPGPPLIPLEDLNYIERRRLNLGRVSACVTLCTQGGNFYGPFQFTHGGSRHFIHSLRTYVELQPSQFRPDRFNVYPKIVYQLPGSDPTNLAMSTIQGFGRRVFDSLRAFPPVLEVFPSPTPPVPKPSPIFSDPKEANQSMLDFVAEDRSHILQDDLISGEDAEFQIITHADKRPFIKVPDLVPVKRQPALSLEEWQRHLDRDGRVTVVEKLQTVIFLGGIEPKLRSTVWKYMLGYYKWDFTEAENLMRAEEKKQKYQIIKTYWKAMSVAQIRHFRAFRERKSLIEKDTYRTDRYTTYFHDDVNGNLTRLYNILITYTMYNIDLGYFQGMNDLLAIIMTVVEGEEEAFWCFAGLMERMSEHFSDGRFSITNQFTQIFKLIEILMPKFAQFLRDKEATSMNFCFKWLLIMFKREFCYNDVKILWEAMWSVEAPKTFQLLIAVAIFDLEADGIMTQCDDISQILQYINELSEKINVHKLLSRAQGIFHQLVEVKDRLPEDVAISLGLAPPPAEENRATENEDVCFPEEDSFIFSSCRSGSSLPLASLTTLEDDENRRIHEDDSSVLSNGSLSVSSQTSPLITTNSVDRKFNHRESKSTLSPTSSITAFKK